MEKRITRERLLRLQASVQKEVNELRYKARQCHEVGCPAADALQKNFEYWSAGLQQNMPIGFRQLEEKWKEAVDLDENPEYQEYLRLAEKFGEIPAPDAVALKLKKKFR